MTAHLTPLTAVTTASNTAQLDKYVGSRPFDKPTLVSDLDRFSAQFQALKAGLGRGDIHYAVKANPAREVIARLVDLGAHFDAASKAEIALCLAEGARPESISFGNTIKRSSDIAWAWGEGIKIFAVDAAEELEKIAINALGASVYIRLIVELSEADWSLSRKFGCDRGTALHLLDMAVASGLHSTSGHRLGARICGRQRWMPCPRFGKRPLTQVMTCHC